MGCCGEANETDCTSQPDRLECPVNHKLYKQVSSRTVLHNVAHPWKLSPEGKAYYFCDDSDCDIVYFDNTGAAITRSELRTTVGAGSLSGLPGLASSTTNQYKARRFMR